MDHQQHEPTQRELAEKAQSLKEASQTSGTFKADDDRAPEIRALGCAEPSAIRERRDFTEPPPDRFLPARQVLERYSVSDMTLFRWLRSPQMKFPRPVYFGRLRFWRERDLTSWERSRPTIGQSKPKLETV
jgi:predicted DNA-binding transcriptional regulator AlpA